MDYVDFQYSVGVRRIYEYLSYQSFTSVFNSPKHLLSHRPNNVQLAWDDEKQECTVTATLPVSISFNTDGTIMVAAIDYFPSV
jgi:hypothetical protein